MLAMKIINYLSLLLILYWFTSCEYSLDEIPKSTASPENYYKTEDHLNAAVVGVYNALQRTGAYAQKQHFITTDIVRTASWNTQGGIGTYTFSADNSQVILPIWVDHYRGINEANAAINNIPNADVDEDLKQRLIAEATFIRVLFYFNLIRYFGDVPYITQNTTSLDELLVQRDPVDKIYQNLITDLEFCIEHLNPKGDSEPGRATVGSAKSVLSKVYLTRGSMAKRDGTSSGMDDFTKAAQYAKEVIDAAEYQLEDYYPDVFIIENKNNDEIVFDVQFKAGGINEGNFIGMHMGLQGPKEKGGSWGNINATDFYHTMFEDSDMVRMEWNTPHVRVKGDGTLKTDYSEMHWEVWKIGKFRRYPVRNPNFNFDDHEVHWPVFRYAEVLLVYAEALNEINSGPTQEIFDVLNQLRARARNVNGDGTMEYLHEDILPRELTYDTSILPDISVVDYPDYASLQQYIMDERARELGGETKRWFDLVRWGKLVENIQYLDQHIPPGRTSKESKDWSITAGNVQPHHMLFPIPQSEINANPNLTQNPGY